MAGSEAMSQTLPTPGHSVCMTHPSSWRKTRRGGGRRRQRSRKSHAKRHLPEEENWEEEIRESLSPKDSREESCCPYDPEDALGLNSHQDGALWGQRCSPMHEIYNPSMHHTPPIKWVHQLKPVAPGQFVDAQE